MRLDLAVKLNMLFHALTKAVFLGIILSAVCLFFFKCCKRVFKNSVVMWAASGGKRLLDTVLLKKQCKSSRGVLPSSIAMECQIFRLTALLISILKCKCSSNQVGTGITRYSINKPHVGIEIQNNTEIYPIVIDPKVCNSADSYLVWILCWSVHVLRGLNEAV